MILKRLIEILKTFDKEELKKFERFLRSDFFNTNESITGLFKALKKFYPEFNSSLLTQEKLFRQIYGSRKFDDKTFRYLITELYELAEKYLAISAYDRYPVEEKKILIDELLTRKLFSHANRHLKAADKEFEHEPVFSIDNINNKKEFAILWNHLSLSMDKQEAMADKRLELAENFVYYAISELVTIYNILIGIKNAYNIDFDSRIVESFIKNMDFKSMLKSLDDPDILENISKSKWANIQAFKAYICFIITLLDIKDEIYFYRMKDILENSSNLFASEDLYNLYGMLDSCCHLKRMAIDDNKYLREYFILEKSALDKGLLTHSEEQFMQAGSFIRLFDTAITLGEPCWAKNLIDKYLDKTSPELKDDISNYSKAQLNFLEGKYENALDCITKVKFGYFTFKVYVRSLMLKIYYELNYTEEVFSLIDSFSGFLNENKRVNPNIRTDYLNFLLFVKNLLKNKTGDYSKEKQRKVADEITKCNTVANKPWLLEKAGELF